MLLLGLELLGRYAMPTPRRIAAWLAAWALLVLVLPAVVRRRKSDQATPARAEKLGLALIGLALAFLALETATNSLFPDYPLEIAPDPGSPVPLVQKDAQLRGRLTPGFHGRFLRWPYRGISVRINEKGFRDRPWARPSRSRDKPIRLLAVGDSFTFGTGVSEDGTYLRELERLSAGNLLTFNAGVPGFGPIDELFVLRRHLEEVGASLAIFGLYTGNDLDDVLLAIDRLARPATDGSGAAAVGKPRSASPSTHHPHLAEILRSLGRREYWLRTCRICNLAAPSLSGWAERFGLVSKADAKASLLLRACSRAPDPEVERVTRIIIDTLDDASEFCRWRGARLAVMLIPLREFVEPGAFERALARTVGRQSDDLSPDVLHDRLRTEIEKRGLPVLDLLPALRSRAAEGTDLFVPDGHLNREGNQEVARALAAFLRGGFARRTSLGQTPIRGAVATPAT